MTARELPDGRVEGQVSPVILDKIHAVGAIIETRDDVLGYQYFYVRADGKAYPLEWNGKRIPGQWHDEVSRYYMTNPDLPARPESESKRIDYAAITRSISGRT
jgi:hypothetical protein